MYVIASRMPSQAGRYFLGVGGPKTLQDSLTMGGLRTYWVVAQPARKFFPVYLFFSIFYSRPGNEGQLEGVVPNNRRGESCGDFGGLFGASDFVKGEWTHPQAWTTGKRTGKQSGHRGPYYEAGGKLFIRGLRLNDMIYQ